MEDKKIQSITIGEKFRIRRKNDKSYYYIVCECECGNKFITRFSKKMNNKSCGCNNKSKKYQSKDIRAYNTWHSMIQRCGEGGSYYDKGITICDRWYNFEYFLIDMGIRPKNKTLDRVNNNDGYYKDNCRWATLAEQAANRSNSIYLNIDGINKTAKEWSKEKGAISYTAILDRIKKGLTDSYEIVFGETKSKNKKRYLTINGITKYITEWCKVEGAANRSTISKRLKIGLTAEEAVFGYISSNRGN